MRLPKSAVAIAAGVLLALNSGSVAAQPRYSIVDLGESPGARAHGINDLGQIVGLFNGHPTVWDHGAVVDLDPQSGQTRFTNANAINNHGQIVGLEQMLTTSTAAIFWDSPTSPLQQIFTASGSQTKPHGNATAINDSGQIAGFSGDGAVLFENGTVTILTGTPDDLALGINSQGQVVGDSLGPDGNGVAVVWHDGTVTPLGKLAGTSQSQAMGINSHGEVVGTSDAHAVRWSSIADPTITDLGADSIARAINNSGQAVGEASGHAVVWDSGSAQPVPLGELPGTSQSSANAINSSGQIVGFSGNHAVLWQKRVGTQMYPAVN